MADFLGRTRLLIGSTGLWASNNIVLGDGELALELSASGVKGKVGNGSATWSALAYVFPTPGGLMADGSIAGTAALGLPGVNLQLPGDGGSGANVVYGKLIPERVDIDDGGLYAQVIKAGALVRALTLNNVGQIKVEGGSTGEGTTLWIRNQFGDSLVWFDSDAADWVIGQDASDSNALVIASSTALGTSNRLRIDFTTGNVSIGSVSAPTATRLYVSGSALRARMQDSAASAASAIAQSMPGLELVSGAMDTTNKYSMAIKFGSADAQFTTTNPKFGALIVAEASEAYGADTDGGMGLLFYTTPDDPGTGGGLVLRKKIGANGVSEHFAGTANVPNTVAFSGTPAFDARLSNYHELGVLTANVTAPTITNPTPGQTIIIRVKQDGTGGWTFADPSGAKIAGTVGLTIGAASHLQLTYSLADTRWEGFWTQLPA